MSHTPRPGRTPGSAVIMITAMLAIAALLFLPVAHFAIAAEPPKPLTLEEALRRTLQRNRSLSAARLDARAAAARARDAGKRPNPELSVEAENFGGALGGSVIESSVSLSQAIELGGDRAARAGAAAEESRTARGAILATERAVAAESAERLFAAWTLQQRVEFLRLAVGQAREAVTTAEARHRAGAAPEFEQVRAKAHLASRELEYRRGLTELAVAKRRLVLQWNGSPEEADSIALPEPSSTEAPSPDSIRAQLASHPERARAEADVRAIEWRLRAARAARVPDPSVEAGVRRLAELRATGFTIGISVPLPLWNGGTGAVSSAESQRDAARFRVESVEADLAERARSAREQLLAAWSTYQGVRDELRPGAEEALRLVRAAYGAGRLSYLEILEGQRSVLEANLLSVEAHADVWRATTMLELLAGGLPGSAEGN